MAGKAKNYTEDSFFTELDTIQDSKTFIKSGADWSGKWNFSEFNKYGANYVSAADENVSLTVGVRAYKRIRGIDSKSEDRSVMTSLDLTSEFSDTQYTVDSYKGWKVAKAALALNPNVKATKDIFKTLFDSGLASKPTFVYVHTAKS